jgi:hypothetical protein
MWTFPARRASIAFTRSGGLQTAELNAGGLESAPPWFCRRRIVPSDMLDDLFQIILASSGENYSPAHERTA